MLAERDRNSTFTAKQQQRTRKLSHTHVLSQV